MKTRIIRMTPHTAMIKVFLKLWSLGALISGIAHLVAPQFMAAGTSWPLAYGWQREVALFDIMLALYIGAEVILRPAAQLRTLSIALTSLSLGLGVNHVLSAVYAQWSYVHKVGAIANAIAVVAGLFLISSGQLAASKADA